MCLPNWLVVSLSRLIPSLRKDINKYSYLVIIKKGGEDMNGPFQTLLAFVSVHIQTHLVLQRKNEDLKGGGWIRKNPWYKHKCHCRWLVPLTLFLKDSKEVFTQGGGADSARKGFLGSGSWIWHQREEIFIRWTMSIFNLVYGKQIPKKY